MSWGYPSYRGRWGWGYWGRSWGCSGLWWWWWKRYEFALETAECGEKAVAVGFPGCGVFSLDCNFYTISKLYWPNDQLFIKERYTPHIYSFLRYIVRKILCINIFCRSSSASCTWKLNRPSKPVDVSFGQPITQTVVLPLIYFGIEKK